MHQRDVFLSSVDIIISKESGVLLLLIKHVSSANNLGIEFTALGRLLIYKRNNTGPSVDSWAIDAHTLLVKERMH